MLFFLSRLNFWVDFFSFAKKISERKEGRSWEVFVPSVKLRLTEKTKTSQLRPSFLSPFFFPIIEIVPISIPKGRVGKKFYRNRDDFDPDFVPLESKSERFR
jgi:hypothetical protein